MRAQTGLGVLLTGIDRGDLPRRGNFSDETACFAPRIVFDDGEDEVGVGVTRRVFIRGITRSERVAVFSLARPEQQHFFHVCFVPSHFLLPSKCVSLSSNREDSDGSDSDGSDNEESSGRGFKHHERLRFRILLQLVKNMARHKPRLVSSTR